MSIREARGQPVTLGAIKSTWVQDPMGIRW